MTEISTDLAIEAFRAVGQKKYQLEMKEYELLKACNGNLDMQRYYIETEKVAAKYEADREHMRHLGRLPRT